jgi:hypothetical protein
VETVLGRLPLAEPPPPSLLAEPYCVLIRPDAARIAAGDEDGPAQLIGEVTAASFRGGLYRLQIAPRQAPDQPLTFELPTRGHELLSRTGAQVQLHLDAQGVLLVRESEP